MAGIAVANASSFASRCLRQSRIEAKKVGPRPVSGGGPPCGGLVVRSRHRRSVRRVLQNKSLRTSIAPTPSPLRPKTAPSPRKRGSVNSDKDSSTTRSRHRRRTNPPTPAATHAAIETHTITTMATSFRVHPMPYHRHGFFGRRTGGCRTPATEREDLGEVQIYGAHWDLEPLALPWAHNGECGGLAARSGPRGSCGKTVRLAHVDQGWGRVGGKREWGAAATVPREVTGRRAGCGGTPHTTTWAPQTSGKEDCERTGPQRPWVGRPSAGAFRRILWPTKDAHPWANSSPQAIVGPDARRRSGSPCRGAPCTLDTQAT